MINLTDRKCPACQENLDSKPSVLPDINPEDNIDIIKNYWRGTYKQKNFFPIIDVNVAFYIIRNFLIKNH